jgi:hypothetical protein
MVTVVEVLAVLVLAAAVAVLASRFPDTRKAFGDELDNAMYRGGVRALWLFVTVGAVALLALWLLL